jgi:hypothetical protein
MNRLLLLWVLSGLVTLSSQARAEEALGFTRACNVLQDPDTKSRVMCRGIPGDSILSIERQGKGFYSVNIDKKCSGFVTDSCLALPHFKKIRRDQQSADKANYQRFQFGPVVEADLIFTSDTSNTGFNKGWGVEVGAKVDIPVWDRFRISPVVKYASWKITRDLTSSGVVVTPPSSVAQSLTFLVLGASIGYTFGNSFGNSYSSSSVDQDAPGNRTFWMEAGLEYLTPLSATQTISGGSATEFTNTEKPLLVTLMGGIDWPLTYNLLVGTHLGGFYNVAANQGARLLGGRFQTTLTYGFE